MSHLSFYLLLFLFFSFLSANSQKKWDDGGKDDEWNNALNWSDDALPGPDDDIILDNSLTLSGYKVNLPAGNISVTVRSIHIIPSFGNHIELVLPAVNTALPALIVTGSGYGLDIGNAGIFRNSSGASSGTPVVITDSIRIQNGGRYIHNTQRAHATNVQVLSLAPGTEKGIMEFDVPDLSSTISLSGRNYGKLLLRATSIAGGKLKYTAAGVNGMRVRDDFEIGEGVSLGLNFGDTIWVEGNCIENGVLDLGNTARNMVLAVKGNFNQSVSGLITESGTGSQEILLNGQQPQFLDMRGVISNTVELTVNSTNEISLLSPLTLPHRLSLVNGIINTSSHALLVLDTNCSVLADTLLAKSFVSGPLRKLGMDNSHFVFPVGKQLKMRWLELKNTTGSFTVEYIQDDPYHVSDEMGPGLDHISHLEYWNVISDVAVANATTVLSFVDPVSGQVTDLTSLRVAMLHDNVWKDQGNIAAGGIAGADGWVSSSAAGGFSAGINYFALASAFGRENPLPFSEIVVRLEILDEACVFKWRLISEADVDRFELQGSSEGDIFTTLDWLPADKRNALFNYSYHRTDPQIKCFRIVARDNEGRAICFSNVVLLKPQKENIYSVSGQNISSSVLLLALSAPRAADMRFIIFNSMGARMKESRQYIYPGHSEIRMDITKLGAGLYFLLGYTNENETIRYKFIKR